MLLCLRTTCDRYFCRLDHHTSRTRNRHQHSNFAVQSYLCRILDTSRLTFLIALSLLPCTQIKTGSKAQSVRCGKRDRVSNGFGNLHIKYQHDTFIDGAITAQCTHLFFDTHLCLRAKCEAWISHRPVRHTSGAKRHHGRNNWINRSSFCRTWGISWHAAPRSCLNVQ